MPRPSGAYEGRAFYASARRFLFVDASGELWAVILLPGDRLVVIPTMVSGGMCSYVTVDGLRKLAGKHAAKFVINCVTELAGGERRQSATPRLWLRPGKWLPAHLQHLEWDQWQVETDAGFGTDSSDTEIQKEVARMRRQTPPYFSVSANAIAALWVRPPQRPESRIIRVRERPAAPPADAVGVYWTPWFIRPARGKAAAAAGAAAGAEAAATGSGTGRVASGGRGTGGAGAGRGGRGSRAITVVSSDDDDPADDSSSSAVTVATTTTHRRHATAGEGQSASHPRRREDDDTLSPSEIWQIGSLWVAVAGLASGTEVARVTAQQMMMDGGLRFSCLELPPTVCPSMPLKNREYLRVYSPRGQQLRWHTVTPTFLRTQGCRMVGAKRAATRGVWLLTPTGAREPISAFSPPIARKLQHFSLYLDLCCQIRNYATVGMVPGAGAGDGAGGGRGVLPFGAGAGDGAGGGRGVLPFGAGAAEAGAGSGGGVLASRTVGLPRSSLTEFMIDRQHQHHHDHREYERDHQEEHHHHHVMTRGDLAHDPVVKAMVEAATAKGEATGQAKGTKDTVDTVVSVRRSADATMLSVLKEFSGGFMRALGGGAHAAATGAAAASGRPLPTQPTSSTSDPSSVLPPSEPTWPQEVYDVLTPEQSKVIGSLIKKATGYESAAGMRRCLNRHAKGEVRRRIVESAAGELPWSTLDGIDGVLDALTSKTGDGE